MSWLPVFAVTLFLGATSDGITPQLFGLEREKEIPDVSVCWRWEGNENIVVNSSKMLSATQSNKAAYAT